MFIGARTGLLRKNPRRSLTEVAFSRPFTSTLLLFYATAPCDLRLRLALLLPGGMLCCSLLTIYPPLSDSLPTLFLCDTRRTPDKLPLWSLNNPPRRYYPCADSPRCWSPMDPISPDREIPRLHAFSREDYYSVQILDVSLDSVSLSSSIPLALSSYQQSVSSGLCPPSQETNLRCHGALVVLCIHLRRSGEPGPITALLGPPPQNTGSQSGLISADRELLSSRCDWLPGIEHPAIGQCESVCTTDETPRPHRHTDTDRWNRCKRSSRVGGGPGVAPSGRHR